MYESTPRTDTVFTVGLSRTPLAIRQAWQERIWLCLFFAVLCIGLLSPISSNTVIPNLADYINCLAAVIEAKIAFVQGQFPLRTMPYALGKLGYPLYQFYSPTSFTFMGLIYWLITPANPLSAMNLAIGCGLMAGGLSMYYLTHWLVQSKPVAILAGVVYLYAPYYVVLVEHLGAIQEILALGILPAILYWILQQYHHPADLKIFLRLSVGLYIFFTLHIPTAVYASVFFAILLGCISLRNGNCTRHLLAVIAAYSLAFFMMMWFIAPAIMLQKYFVISSTYSDPNHLILYRPTLANLLFAGAAITHDSNLALQTIHPSLGLPIIAAAAICLFAYFNKKMTGYKRADELMPAFLLIFFLAFLLAWSPINIWRWLPQYLWVAQYCWRLVGHVTWIGTLLFAWAMCWLFKNQLEIKHVVLGVIVILLCANPWFATAVHWIVNRDTFIKNPYFIYNQNEIAIDYATHPNLISQIDNIEFDPTQVQLNSIDFIPASMLNFNPHPLIILSGTSNQNTRLKALLNNHIIASQSIPTGLFQWQIPFSVSKSQTAAQLKFESEDKTTVIHANQFLLTGYLQPNETLSFEQVASTCSQIGAIKTCQIYAPHQIKIMELPQIYYPKLLKITLNGKEVPYHSVLTHNQLMAFINPLPGQLNQITIEFRGLEWANRVSWVAWISWLALTGYVLIKHNTRRIKP